MTNAMHFFAFQIVAEMFEDNVGDSVRRHTATSTLATQCDDTRRLPRLDEIVFIFKI